MSRPWSPAEVEEAIPEIMEAIDAAVIALADAFDEAAEATHAAKKARALAWLKVTGRNKEEREARVYLYLHEPDVTVGDLEYRAELAEGRHRSESLRIRALQTKADLLRSMLVSSRATGA